MSDIKRDGVRCVQLSGPWSVSLLAVHDREAVVAAQGLRIPKGLALEGSLDRLRDHAHPGPERLTHIPAAVPGAVHLDLMRAGLLEDPWQGLAEERQHWVGRTSWRYETTFVVDRALGRTSELVFEGLDTFATVTLNGIQILRAENMHRSHIVDVTDLLVDGMNELTVDFDAQADTAEARRLAAGGLPNAYPDPTNFVRKMACNFGWDWGPTVVTAGIWKPIRLQQWSDARFEAVRAAALAPGGTPMLDVSGTVAVDGDGGDFVATITLGDETWTVPVDGSAFRLQASLPDLPLWWPRGYGEQPLHDLEVTLSSREGQTLDRWSRRVGFKSVAVEHRPDDLGTGFHLVVNGQPIWVRGANWIPEDLFPARMTEERYRQRVAQAVEANMNLLRVWGGGIYESDDFYSVCDELGVMVWQDFLFACAAYPEDEATWTEVEAEAREAVTRLMSHASLTVWNGSNENTWGYWDWEWQEPLAGRAWGYGYYDKLLPSIIDELDPAHAYVPSSPWSGALDVYPNDDAHGTKHIWDVWNQVDYLAYRDHRPRFVVEYGFQAPATFSTLAASVGMENLDEDSPEMRGHQKALDGRAKLRRGLDLRFPLMRGFDDWLFLTQLEQARALRVGITHLRSDHDVCTGSIIWQLNDCWPAVSWAIVDSAGRFRPSWFAVRRAYADRLSTIQPDGAGLTVCLVNDTADDWAVDGCLTRYGFDGERLADQSVMISVPAHGALRLPVSTGVRTPGQPRREVLVLDVEGVRDTWFFGEDADLEYSKPRFDASAVSEGEDALVTVTAETLLREVCLFPDRIHAEAFVDDALVTLLPGESHTFVVTGGQWGAVELGLLTSAPVLRMANDVGWD